MTAVFSFIGAVIPLAILYFLWRCYRELQTIADESNRRKELSETIKKFGVMFAEAAEVPKPPGKKKVVSFEAEA